MKKIAFLALSLALLGALGATGLTGCSSTSTSPTEGSSRAVILDSAGNPVLGADLILDGTVVGTTDPVTGEISLELPPGTYEVQVVLDGQPMMTTIVEVENDGSVEVEVDDDDSTSGDDDDSTSSDDDDSMSSDDDDSGDDDSE